MFGKQRILLNKRTICFAVAIMAVFGASVVFTAVAAERSGMYWANMGDLDQEPTQEDSKGFMMADVSDSWQTGDVGAEVAEEETEVISLAIGPTPSIPTLTAEELKLYGLLSRGDGFLTDADREELNKDIHWREVVLEKGDTVESVAAEYNVPVKDILSANELKATDNLKTAEVLYIPDSNEYVLQTLAYVRKLKKAEAEFKQRTKPVESRIHVIESGDSLWSLASQYNLELDSIIGSNSLSDINKLKLGTKLRIPNQDGIYVKIDKKDTVSKLAEKYGSSKDAIYAANMMLESAALVEGKEIFLPGARVPSVTQTKGSSGIAKKTTARISGGVKFRWPVVGRISSGYGWRRNPFGTRRTFHAGLDISAPKGRSIVAAAAGKVVHSGWMGGYGYTIVIAHIDGTNTLYGHCSSLVAKRGQSVKSGELIARVGSTGRSTGNHLHFEARTKGATQNPLKYLR